MKLQHKKSIVFLGLGMIVLTSSLRADESIQKTLAICYEEGKTPDALFQHSLGYFQKLIEPGYLKSVSLGTAKIFGNVLDIQTPTDNITQAKIERDIVANHVHDLINASNVPYTGKFTILATNLLFGDKSLGFILNPYKGCYDHNYLAKGFEQAGYKIVDASEQPNITMTIGIDACMTENEFKEYVQKNTTLKLKNANAGVDNNSGSSSIGNNLIRSGSSAQLGTPSGGGNVGMAVAGVGLALNMVNWMTTKSPQERDVIRYHVKFEGKDKQPLDFYPIVITKNTHKAGEPIHITAKNEAEQFLFTSFVAWNSADKAFGENLPPLLLEKDILKMTELIISAKK